MYTGRTEQTHVLVLSRVVTDDSQMTPRINCECSQCPRSLGWRGRKRQGNEVPLGGARVSSSGTSRCATACHVLLSYEGKTIVHIHRGRNRGPESLAPGWPKSHLPSRSVPFLDTSGPLATRCRAHLPHRTFTEANATHQPSLPKPGLAVRIQRGGNGKQTRFGNCCKMETNVTVGCLQRKGNKRRQLSSKLPRALSSKRGLGPPAGPS